MNLKSSYHPTTLTEVAMSKAVYIISFTRSNAELHQETTYWEMRKDYKDDRSFHIRLRELIDQKLIKITRK